MCPSFRTWTGLTSVVVSASGRASVCAMDVCLPSSTRATNGGARWFNHHQCTEARAAPQWMSRYDECMAARTLARGPRALRSPRRRQRDVPVPIAAARDAGLRYVLDVAPGIRRRRAGRGFRYLGPDGQPLRDPKVLRRIKALAIPPAWTDVWIAPIPNAHLQATGRDARGRKQYRYHPCWRAVRDAAKYEHMLAFGEALPTLRARIAQDLERPGLPREKVLALVVRLLDMTLIRVGNEEYARANQSFGLTTLRTHHAQVEGTRIRFQFRGKSGKEWSVVVTDRRLSRVVRRCQELPGHELFQYVDAEGQQHAIGSEDVNAYLRELCGADFTAKDFRTWAGTLLAAQELAKIGPAETEREATHHLVAVIKRVAQHLGNTPAVCRACYVHPGVIEAYLAGIPLAPAGGTDIDDAAVVSFLRQCAEGHLARAS